MKKFLPIIIGAIILTILVSPISIAKEFVDVSTAHWAYNYINELSNNGVINGYQNGSFNPSGTITKAEYIKLLVGSIATEEELNAMQEQIATAEEWFIPYYEYAMQRGILSQEYSIADLKTTVSRKEMATILVDFADYVGLGLSDFAQDPDLEYEEIKFEDEEFIDEQGELVNFNQSDDVMVLDDLSELEELLLGSLAEVSEDAEVEERDVDEPNANMEEYVSSEFTDLGDLKQEEKEAINYAFELGLINGYEDGTFKPNNNMNRAEVSTIVYRFTEAFEKVNVSYVDSFEG